MRAPASLILSGPILIGALAQAATLGPSPLDPDSSATAGSFRLLPCSITQNDDPAVIEPGTSVACHSDGIVRDTWFGRVYDLDGEYGQGGTYCVSDLDYALESVTAPTPVEYRVSCVPDGTAGNPDGVVSVAALDAGEVFSVEILDGPAELEFFNVALGGCCDGGISDLAVFSITADCVEVGCAGYWPGANTRGQTHFPYIAAPDCGIVDPIETPPAGFPYMHLIQVVNGDGDACGDGGDGGDGVPAGSGLGAVLAVLVVLGCSSYFLRRRALN